MSCFKANDRHYVVMNSLVKDTPAHNTKNEDDVVKEEEEEKVKWMVCDKKFSICIQPRKCHKQIVTGKIVTNLNNKYMALAKNNTNTTTTTTIIINKNNNFNKNDNNNYEKSIISISQSKQFNTLYYKQQQQVQQSSSLQLILRPANNIGNFLQNLIYMKQFATPLVTLLIITLLFTTLLPSTQASCRYEPSRPCEAICKSIWSPAVINSNYQSSLRASNDVTTWANDYNCTIRALVLMPDDDRYVASLKRVVPILQVAEQRIHARGLLPSFIQFDWMPQDDKCDAAFATVKAMDGIVKNCSHVLFGPVCDYSLAAVGRIAKYFNSHGTPLISVGGSTFDFEKPKTKCADEFYMLLRTGMLSFESISELTIAVMKSYKWSRSIFFYDADGQRNVAGQHTCYLMMTSLGKQMRNENMTFAQYRITEKLRNRTEEMTREIGNKNSGKLIRILT